MFKLVLTLETKTATLESTSTSEAAKVSALETSLAAEQSKTTALETTLAAEQIKVTALETALALFTTQFATINSKCLEEDDSGRRLAAAAPCDGSGDDTVETTAHLGTATTMCTNINVHLILLFMLMMMW